MADPMPLTPPVSDDPTRPWEGPFHWIDVPGNYEWVQLIPSAAGGPCWARRPAPPEPPTSTANDAATVLRGLRAPYLGEWNAWTKGSMSGYNALSISARTVLAHLHGRHVGGTYAYCCICLTAERLEQEAEAVQGEPPAAPSVEQVAKVLAEHKPNYMTVGCSCGWRCTSGIYKEQHRRHQAHVLAAAGLLADAEPIRRLREALQGICDDWDGEAGGMDEAVAACRADLADTDPEREA